MRKSRFLIAAVALSALAGCSSVHGWVHDNFHKSEAVAPETLAPAEPAMAVAVHKGEFATIQQFDTAGGVSV